MSNRQRTGEKLFLVLFGHSHRESHSPPRGMAHSGTRRIHCHRQGLPEGANCLQRPGRRRNLQSFTLPRPPASTVLKIG